MSFNAEAWWFALSGENAPGKPEGFSVTVTPGTARLRATVDNGGLAITKWQYRVATSSAGIASASWVDFSASASTSLDKNLSLAAGATRYYQVRAVNSLGTGEASNIVSGTDSRVAPLAPTGFTVTATSARRFRLRASVDNGGAAITKWQYRIATTAGGLSSATWTDVSSSAANSLDHTPSTVFAGGTTRFFQVRAVNLIGNGAASGSASATIGNVVTRDTDSIYRRGTTAPGTPTGGTDSETHLPSGWSRTNLGATATQNLYRSQRTRTYTNGVFTSATAWGTVAKVADMTATEPAKPTGFTVTATGARQFRLRASVDNGGSAITKWQRKGASSAAGLTSASWTDIGSSANSDLDFTVPTVYAGGTTRHFQVRAVNALGNGSASDSASATIADVVTTDTDSIYIRGTTAPSTPTGGTSDADDLPTGWARSNPGATTTQNVYRSQRTRTYTNGSFTSASAWGAVEKVADKTAGEPSKPTGFSATPSGPSLSSGTVRLRASVANNGSAIIRWQYRVATSSAGVSSASWVNFSSSASDSLDKSLTLSAGVTRYYQVRAVNNIGNGPASDIDSARVARITRDTDRIYIRGTTAPATPTGGTNSENHLPTGTSRSNPGATITQNVYRSQRTRTYHDGAFQSASSWSAWSRIAGPTTVLLTTVGAGSWTVPAGVSSIILELVGGGGGGGAADNSAGAGAGGGGTTFGTARAGGGGGGGSAGNRFHVSLMRDSAGGSGGGGRGSGGTTNTIQPQVGTGSGGGGGGSQIGSGITVAGFTGRAGGPNGGGDGGGRIRLSSRFRIAAGGGGGTGDTANGGNGGNGNEAGIGSDLEGEGAGGASGSASVTTLAAYGGGGNGEQRDPIAQHLAGWGGGGGGGGYTRNADYSVTAETSIAYHVAGGGGAGGRKALNGGGITSLATAGTQGAIRITYVG